MGIKDTQTVVRPKRHRKPRIALVVLTCLVVACTVGFLAYASDYYHADATAQAVLQSDTTLEVEGSYTVLAPDTPSDTALIFYPGAKMEHTAYLPLLEQLKERGITCILVEMPFNMAIFDVNAADGAFALAPGVTHWFIGGHSMGGAMASAYASGHQDAVDGLILLGAYVYGDYPPARALTIYGSLNSNLEKDIDYTDNIVVIDGGNHAQFGNYGKQAGDPDATISAEEQQAAAVDAIVRFIDAEETGLL